jgi:hypothetical protein
MSGKRLTPSNTNTGFFVHGGEKMKLKKSGLAATKHPKGLWWWQPTSIPV